MISHKQNGFSLLEILIAVSILATSLVILLSAQGGSFLSSERAERLTEATLLARGKMVEIEIEFEKDLAKNKFPEEDLENSGEFEAPYEDYRWKYTVKKVEIPFVDAGKGENVLVESYSKNVMDLIAKSVREIQLRVFWGDKDRPEKDQPHLIVTTHWVKLK